MIDVLIQGKLFAKPQERVGKTGAPFAVAKLTAAAGGGERLFVSCIAFDGDAVAALLALDAGDAVAVAGSATPTAREDRDGNWRPSMDVVVHRVLTAYHVSRKRNAVASVAGGG